MKAAHWTIPTAVFLAFCVPAVAAAQVPTFDINRNCKSASSTSKSLSSCLNDEQSARELLADRWSRFSVAERQNCVQETTSDNTPSYVELLVCLQFSQEAKKLSKKGLDFPPFPAEEAKK